MARCIGALWVCRITGSPWFLGRFDRGRSDIINVAKNISRYTPYGLYHEMAGILALRVYMSPSPSQPILPVAFEGHYPLTVAGAAVVLAPYGYTSPRSLLIHPSCRSGGTIMMKYKSFLRMRNIPYHLEDTPSKTGFRFLKSKIWLKLR